MKEKWVRINTIEGYEDIRDCYYISNSDQDKVMNKDTGRMMKIWINTHGYPTVSLMTKDKKHRGYRIHVLKAKTFIHTVNPLNYKYLRHLNDVKTDNRLINLVWGTASENMKDRVRNGNFNYEGAIKGGKISGKNTGVKNGKKRSKPVRCVETNTIYTSACEASRQLKISRSNISDCCSGRYKTAGGYHFEFVD